MPVSMDSFKSYILSIFDCVAHSMLFIASFSELLSSWIQIQNMPWVEAAFLLLYWAACICQFDWKTCFDRHQRHTSPLCCLHAHVCNLTKTAWFNILYGLYSRRNKFPFSYCSCTVCTAWNLTMCRHIAAMEDCDDDGNDNDNDDAKAVTYICFDSHAAH